jgi:hypothetical protein
MRVLKALWAAWKIIGLKIANVQARALLWVFYFVAFTPFALGVKIFSDPLRLGAVGRTNWLKRDEPKGDALAIARRQF